MTVTCCAVVPIAVRARLTELGWSPELIHAASQQFSLEQLVERFVPLASEQVTDAALDPISEPVASFSHTSEHFAVVPLCGHVADVAARQRALSEARDVLAAAGYALVAVGAPRAPQPEETP